ncbi:MAG: glycosyltransferase family 2 protein [Oscillospiraceae bacterium]|jgi:glycosyltransferase involved in cell wall biosynthesis|nr:glycosyltransferase family 2 protein [Oscillospiraceae bacterium]
MKKQKKLKNEKPISISQCMIVKNEEKNIEKALSWAKGIVCEQIVVDTGSTDRTVEIAERMGAKIFYFEWIGDFSAAKNYAIEQATGDWIAFLDADESFSPEDVKKLLIFMKRIEADKQMREKYLALGCKWVDIDERGRIFNQYVQLRIFQNLPSIRYVHKVHERLKMDPDNIVLVDEIKGIHTGYQTAALIEKDKHRRNVELIRVELAEEPDNLSIKAYLADSLKSVDDEASKKEADDLYQEVIDSGIGAPVHYALKHNAYRHFLRRYAENPDKQEELLKLCEKAMEEFPDQADFKFYLAFYYNNIGEFDKAWKLLKECEKTISLKLDVEENFNILSDPTMIYNQMILAAQGLKDTDNVKKYVKLSTKCHTLTSISLCMIVKNEEKNIKSAIESVDGFVDQIIVVDTGSTDKTIKIARNMGAKIYHFDWIDDFSAAKNFAIEKATSQWIIFLDADEYYSLGDIRKLILQIDAIEGDDEKNKKYKAISNSIINLDDNDRQMTKSKIIRAFKNIPSVRYNGRIHEQLSVKEDEVYDADEIILWHTGYSQSAHLETGKAERNISMLRTELEKNPDDINIKAYLANSLSISEDEKVHIEAEKLFDEIIHSKNKSLVNSVLLIKMYIYLINKYSSDQSLINKAEQVCQLALNDFPNSIDFLYMLAVIESNKGDYNKEWEILKECEAILTSGEPLENSIMISADPLIIFIRMILTANVLGDLENVLLYSMHVLSIDKTRISILSPCISKLLKNGVSENDIINLLSDIYDFDNPTEKNIVIDAANNCGASGLASILTSR